MTTLFDGEPSGPSEGRCRRCHRPLSDAVSLGYSVGPDCREHLGIPGPHKPLRISTSRRWVVIDGQASLLFDDEDEREDR